MVTHPTTRTSPGAQLLAQLSDDLADLKGRGCYRSLTRVEALRGCTVRIDGRERICWCSNDYLGLSGHSAVVAAAATAAREWGVGARASRLLAGTGVWHDRLEAALAAWYGADAAVVFASGYLANLGTLGALCSSEDAVFIDRRSHASLIDAARATRARLRVFRHNDATQLAALLGKAPRARRRFIVTEGVFSMEGDAAPLAALAEVAEAHGAVLYVDDAHGAFVRGPHGRGSCEAEGLALTRVVYMATLGKALGCQGGFVVGPAALVEALRNLARTFIYSTGLSPPVAAAAVAALGVAEGEPARRQRLGERCRELTQRLQTIGVREPGSVPSHIVPVMLGETKRAIAVAHGLWEAGMWAPAIRPPTVQEGAARVRLSVTVEHSAGHIEQLALALKRLTGS